MIRCPVCQHEDLAGRNFCSECGARLTSRCRACGFANAVTAKFCAECGAALADGPPEPRFTSPDAYTPKHLAEKILTSRAALEGERKHVTVLFADMKGSLELLAGRDPEEARSILDPVLELMMHAVHRYEGTVNQVMGDGIMALFGAPVAHEDHAVRACYAALAMQAAIDRHTAEIGRAHGVEVVIRVGLNSGDVVVRAVGSDLRMDYTAVGQTTHLAARMEQMAAPGTIRLTADTVRLAEGFVQVKPVETVAVRGLPEPIAMFELIGAGPSRTRWQALAVRGLTRLVGREAELTRLGRAFERAQAGHGEVVAVIGEPGVGKSRLFWEFTHSHRTTGWLVLETSAASYGKGVPYLPIIELLKAYFQIDARDDQRKIAEKVTGKLLSLDEVLASAREPFFALLNIPVEDPRWEALDSGQRRQRTLEAVKGLLLSESRVRPVLLVVEDLHWIDSETQAILDGLVESLVGARLLLMANFRPEHTHGWGSRSVYTQLRLDPLSHESAEELLRLLLGDSASLEPLKQFLIERTGGNPFFLEESVRTLVETDVLIGERGAYQLAKALPSFHVPATVQAVLAARIDRLPSVEKRLLKSASVIGTDVPYPILHAIVELPEEELQRSLAHLRAAEFLFEASLFPEVEYTFKHALTHEVAYRSVLGDQRRALHARIVEAIEQLYSTRRAEEIERLADHAYRGELWDKALPYLRQAAAKAAARSAHRVAVAYLDRALEVLKHLPEGRRRVEQAIDLRLDLRNSLFPLGDLEQILDRLREAETLAEALGDRRRLGRVACYMANCQRVMANHRMAIESGQCALGVARELGDAALEVESSCYVGQAYYLLGDYRSGIEFLRRGVAFLSGGLGFESFGLPAIPSVFSRTWLAWCLAERGEFAEGIAHGEEAVRIAKAANHPYSLSVALYGLGGVYLRRGDLDKAIPVLEDDLSYCQTGHLPVSFALTAVHLGHAYALSGRLADALPLLEQAVERAGSMRMTTWHSVAAAWLAETYLLAGHVKEAIERVHYALGLFRERGERGHLAWTLRLLGEILTHRDSGEPAKAEAAFAEAVALANELGMPPLVACCRLGFGALYRRTGRLPQARVELSEAIDAFRAMQMTFWLTRAGAELAQAG